MLNNNFLFIWKIEIFFLPLYQLKQLNIKTMPKFEIEIQKGDTKCNKCPFSYKLEGGGLSCKIPDSIDIDCAEFDLSTLKIKTITKH